MRTYRTDDEPRQAGDDRIAAWTAEAPEPYEDGSIPACQYRPWVGHFCRANAVAIFDGRMLCEEHFGDAITHALWCIERDREDVPA